VWENVPDSNNGLYQPGRFKTSIGYSDLINEFVPEKGYAYYWDEEAAAPYVYNSRDKLFATFDDKRSIALKTKYALQNKLNGVMFWELSHDNFKHGLVDQIYREKKNYASIKKK
jgi:chitinase